jgi:hypothetical protein
LAGVAVVAGDFDADDAGAGCDALGPFALSGDDAGHVGAVFAPSRIIVSFVL